MFGHAAKSLNFGIRWLLGSGTVLSRNSEPLSYWLLCIFHFGLKGRISGLICLQIEGSRIFARVVRCGLRLNAIAHLGDRGAGKDSSLSPGIMNLATTPAIKPIIIVHIQKSRGQEIGSRPPREMHASPRAPRIRIFVSAHQEAIPLLSFEDVPQSF